MFRSFYIIRFTAGLLLTVFMLGITPKIYLHDLFAKHIDAPVKKAQGLPFQLNKSGYTCDRDNLVAESNFVYDQPVYALPLFTAFVTPAHKEISFYSIFKSYHQLRGPPAKI